MRDREIGRPYGIRFFEQDGVVMFEQAVDSNNIIGPRPATTADYTAYPVEFGRDSAAVVPEVATILRRGRPPKP